MYYEIHGDPKNPCLVLISGIMSDHLSWASILEQLAQHFYTVIFDNRGVGQNQKNLSDATIEIMAEDVYGLISKLKLNKPHLLGHSMGGAIAQMLAYKYPGQTGKLLLCNTFTRINAVSRLALDVLLDLHHAKFSPGQIMKAILPWCFSSDFLDKNPEFVELTITTGNQALFPQTADAYYAQLQALYAYDSHSFAGNIKNETLIIASKEDRLVPATESVQLEKLINHSKRIILPGGHASFIEVPNRFIQEVVAFME